LSKHLTGQQIPQHILDLPLKVLNSPIVQMLRPVIQNATPRGSKVLDDDVRKVDSEAENIFARMKEFDSLNEDQVSIL
jgi:hypothetical protein